MAHASRSPISSNQLGSLNSAYSTLLAADAFYNVSFIALNNSGVEGGAFLAFNDRENQLTVITGATGVEPGQPHPQHIHGFPSATPPNARPATVRQDDDRDGFVETPEGAETTGPALLNLTSPPGSGLSGFPTPSGSRFVFIETYDLDDITYDANPGDSTPGVPLSRILTADNLDERVLELHGLTLAAGQGENGFEADGTPGYKAILPIAGGEIQRLSDEEAELALDAASFPLGNKVAALDIQGNAGKVYRLYDLFNREPDIQGLTDNVEALDESGRFTDIARSFLLSQEFTTRFGALNSLSNEAYVNLLYRNVLERSADTGGFTNWVTALNQGATREEVLIGFTESPENQKQVAPLLANGILLSESVLV